MGKSIVTTSPFSKEPNLAKRVRLLKAMDMIARTVNDGEVFNYWLIYGIPDGTFKENLPDDDYEYMTDDDDIKAFMDAFLKLMVKASETGGLFYMD